MAKTTASKSDLMESAKAIRAAWDARDFHAMLAAIVDGTTLQPGPLGINRGTRNDLWSAAMAFKYQDRSPWQIARYEDRTPLWLNDLDADIAALR